MYSRGVARFIDGASLSSNVRIVNEPVALEFALPVPASLDLNHFQRETPGRFDLRQVGRVDFGGAQTRTPTTWQHGNFQTTDSTVADCQRSLLIAIDLGAC